MSLEDWAELRDQLRNEGMYNWQVWLIGSRQMLASFVATSDPEMREAAFARHDDDKARLKAGCMVLLDGAAVTVTILSCFDTPGGLHTRMAMIGQAYLNVISHPVAWWPGPLPDPFAKPK